MGRRRLLVVGLGVAGALTAAAAARNPALRSRADRTLRLGRLSARRSTAFVSTRARRLAATEARRAELDEEFLIRSAEDVANELGNMKGAMMKAGQMLSFLFDGLPEPAQQALATLQQDAPPMAPSLAAGVVRSELGADPSELFAEWSDMPAAAASIGQVHRARLHDGREVAVKVQYPGIDTALESDLSNAELLYRMFSSIALKSLDVKSLVNELRLRLLDELDYRLEATCQTEFATRYAGHPFIRIPAVVPEYSTRRVLTTTWDTGVDWDTFLERSTEPERQHAAEVLFRFIQGSIYRNQVFNGDPHPGNYRFHDDGTVTFLDFGLVKRWAVGELESLMPLIDPLLDREVDTLVAHMADVGFLNTDHEVEATKVWEYVSRPYVPYLEDTFTFSPAFTSETLSVLLDVGGPYAEVMHQLNMPPSFVVLDRVVWGMSALLGRLGAHNRWREIFDEYRHDKPPATALGHAEAAWRETATT